MLWLAGKTPPSSAGKESIPRGGTKTHQRERSSSYGRNRDLHDITGFRDIPEGSLLSFKRVTDRDPPLRERKEDILTMAKRFSGYGKH